MFLGGFVEFLGFAHNGDDGAAEFLLSVFDGGFDDRFVFVVVVEDGGCVLRPSIATLAVFGGGVVGGPKPGEGVTEREFFGIIDYPDDFDVAGFFSTHFIVGRGGDVASGEAGYYRMNSFELLKNGFDTPVTASSEGDDLVACGHAFLVVDVRFQFEIFGWSCGLNIGFAGGKGQKAEAGGELE